MNFLLWLVALFLIAHGLIHAMYAAPAPSDSESKWPFQLKHSWLLAPAGLDAWAKPVGTALWILAAAGFAVTGLGLLGIPILHEWWRTLALASAGVSGLLLILFWNPQLVVGVLIDAAIVGVLLWNPAVLGSAA